MIIKRMADALRSRDWLGVILEILIVVIGIFVGLQVNNWNEERKSRNEGYHYLSLLRQELETEIEIRETDLSEMKGQIEQIRRTYLLFFEDSWSTEEYAQFKSDHIAVYPVKTENTRPSALRRLLDDGKIDLVQSEKLQELLFELDRTYQGAFRQSEIYYQSTSKLTDALLRAVPYGTRDDIMALPENPATLLDNQELRSVFRQYLIMFQLQHGAMTALQSERIRVAAELATYLSLPGKASPQPER